MLLHVECTWPTQWDTIRDLHHQWLPRTKSYINSKLWATHVEVFMDSTPMLGNPYSRKFCVVVCWIRWASQVLIQFWRSIRKIFCLFRFKSSKIVESKNGISWEKSLYLKIFKNSNWKWLLKSHVSVNLECNFFCVCFV